MLMSTEGSDDEGLHQVLVDEPIRDYVRDHPSTGRAEEKLSHSEFIESILPDDLDDAGFDHGETAFLKVKPTVRDTLDELAGDRVSRGQVIAFFVLVDALVEGDYESAESMLERLPEILFRESREIPQ